MRSDKSTHQSPPKWLSGLLVADGLYRIERELARGGMGVVHKAIDESNQRPVIIKSLLPEIARDPEYKKRFLREAMEWVNLGAHPHIVRAYTAHEIDYLPRIIAEFAAGGSLSELLKNKPPTLERALAIAKRHSFDSLEIQSLLDSLRSKLNRETDQ